MDEKKEKCGREFVRMQCELAAIMRQRICWYDRVAISNTMTANRQDYESSIKEMEHLCDDSAPPQSERTPEEM